VLVVLGLAACGGGSGDSQASSEEFDEPTASTSTTTTTEPPEDTAPPTTRPEASQYEFPLRPASAGSYSPGHHDYPATDIFAPIGTEFVAPTSGTVDFVSRTDPWDPGTDDPAVRGGISVAIVGDDGIRYYGSHLSEVAPGIEVGVEVEAGDLLGLTGRSGNAAGTDPHLHFGISRPTTPDDWMVRRGEVDPYPHLQAWADGQDVTPNVPGT